MDMNGDMGTMRNKTLLPALAALVLALGTAACGEDSEGGAAASSGGGD